MTKKATIITWSAIGAVIVAAIAFGVMWSMRPVTTVEGYPLDAAGSNDWVEGATSPSVVLVEYSDFECPYCAVYYAVVKQLTGLYPDRLAIVFRNYPLSGHANAMPAAQAAEAAGRQGKFFEMHDLLFDNQDTWSAMDAAAPTFEGYARQLGLNLDRYRTDVASQDVKDRIAQQLKSGDAAKIGGTPTFFLNGTKIQPGPTVDGFRALIDGVIRNEPLTNSVAAPSVHIHANIRVVVDGTPIDFSQDKYQKTADGKELSEDVHFHNANGEVVHVHKTGITVNDLFATFGMNLGRDCLTLDASTTKCATGANKVRLYVNGTQNTDYGNYVFKDLDRVLVIYGSESEAAVNVQIPLVPDTACIYSKTCPERGTPPAEECSGSEATDCAI